ncbi:MAG: hypothetical protein M0C28_46380 [Candidatus Moduliflexus flocculans]|nr:hypothetical protein [Candidatus Moduliflexus flocculans]
MDAGARAFLPGNEKDLVFAQAGPRSEAGSREDQVPSFDGVDESRRWAKIASSSEFRLGGPVR